MRLPAVIALKRWISLKFLFYIGVEFDIGVCYNFMAYSSSDVITSVADWCSSRRGPNAITPYPTIK